MTRAVHAVVVGAGPAGIRAAQTLLRQGLRPIVIDEAALPGGQIYRQPPRGFQRSARDLYGFEAARAQALHQTARDVLAQVDYRPETLVWNAEGGQLDVLCQGRSSTVPYAQLIVATGATDRVLPVPGWTLPGVYSLGGAQVALKYQACAIGRRVVFAGTGPLLYLVAYQYAKAGARVLAVLDSARRADQLAALPDLLQHPAALAKGLYYMAWLRAHGVRMQQGIRLRQIIGQDRVGGLVWHVDGIEQQIDCDAVGIGHGLRPETQLADLLGCRFSHDANQGAWLPEVDAAGRSSVSGVYLAGDGCGIAGADAAELTGERSALALLADAGSVFDAVLQRRVAWLERELARRRRFAAGLQRAFPLPADWAERAPGELVICRCEEITAGALRRTVGETGACEINRLKALSRVGMGRCQGRMCAVAATHILAQASGQPLSQLGRLRGQAPVKPIPFALHPVPATTDPQEPA